jgi:hypothetical protein
MAIKAELSKTDRFVMTTARQKVSSDRPPIGLLCPQTPLLDLPNGQHMEAREHSEASN